MEDIEEDKEYVVEISDYDKESVEIVYKGISREKAEEVYREYYSKDVDIVTMY